MTKTFAALFAAVALSFAFIASAADAPAAPIVLPAKNGDVTFSHKVHAAQKCTACHKDEKGGDIAGIGKDVEMKQAHATCQGCHKEQGKGPKACGDCHKKK